MFFRQKVQASDPKRPFNDLHRDILWEIFSVCADMDLPSEDETPAVDTLRHISQVSSSWRSLAATPSLWARVLNLVRLERSRKWLDEVVRRTEDSRIYVRSCVEHAYRGPDYHVFVKSFLTEHWSRILSLEVKINRSEVIPSEEIEWCTLLTSPSNLRRVKVNFFARLPNFLPFRSPHLELIELSENAMHHLSANIEDGIPQGSISMPNLKKIKITCCWASSLERVLAALCQISPSDHCLLNLDAPLDRWLGDITPAVEFIPVILPKYLRHASKALDSTRNPSAQVIITNSSVDFAISTTSSGSSGDRKPFRFMLRWRGLRAPASVFAKFISSFESFRLKDIHSLSLSILPPKDQPDVATMAIQQFVQTFLSIRSLIVEARSLIVIGLFSKPLGFISIPTLEYIGVYNYQVLTTSQLSQLPSLLGAASDVRVSTL